jgi:hypothetical protein
MCLCVRVDVKEELHPAAEACNDVLSSIVSLSIPEFKECGVLCPLGNRFRYYGVLYSNEQSSYRGGC